MRRLLPLLLIFSATPAHSQGLETLAAAYAKLQRIEKMCLYVVANPYSDKPLLFTHLVSSTPLEGETDDDAATRACVALASSVQPEKTGLTLYCASCSRVALEDPDAD